jgi:hypothetical protein
MPHRRDFSLAFERELQRSVRERGEEVTRALLDQLLPRRPIGRPRYPDTPRLLLLSYELQERVRRETGKELKLATAAKQIDREHNPRATAATFQNITREHRKQQKHVRRMVAVGKAMLTTRRRVPARGSAVFLGLSAGPVEADDRWDQGDFDTDDPRYDAGFIRVR